MDVIIPQEIKREEDKTSNKGIFSFVKEFKNYKKFDKFLFVILILLIINIVFPDPIPFVDEILGTPIIILILTKLINKYS